MRSQCFSLPRPALVFFTDPAPIKGLLVGLGLSLLGGCVTQQTPPTPAEPPASVTTAPAPAPATSLEQLRQQANRGDGDSQFQLGSQYFAAQPRDLNQAQHWWKRAANQGHAGAAVSLAFLHTGRTDPAYKDPQAMLRYLNQAAAGGNAMAQHVLGNFYLRGEESVPRDPQQARRLFQSACQQQYAPSCKALAELPQP
ncbi:MAG: tetratricopeptide repeat protein [Pseudomonas sp.]|uniref:tetratricopeptide repeat protein n=1 Tax=Pseudomonas sp. TaxID=306 RepID=UPI00339A30AD